MYRHDEYLPHLFNLQRACVFIFMNARKRDSIYESSDTVTNDKYDNLLSLEKVINIENIFVQRSFKFVSYFRRLLLISKFSLPLLRK